MANTVDHHTYGYKWNYPVYRRGFPIYLYCPCEDCDNVHSISISITTGRASNGPSVKHLKLVMGYEVNGWTVRYNTSDRPSTIHLIINPPAYAIIGHYHGSVYVNGKLRQNIKFLLFFNPWCKDDAVYLDDENKRQEYVLNTHTLIYMGTPNHITAHGWYLAQFQTYSIEAVLMILDRMHAEDRGSPIRVSRYFSALVNTNDDNGIVAGNWTGKYQGGTNPLSWNGSNNILAKYAKTRVPVKYGQCWVFCGVLCSVLRAVGIPTRCITTFNSFHDHDGSLAWEMYFNRFMKPINFRRQETMWNFHCWNEAWMDRKDLPPGNGGWQVVDSTPQERSQGIFRCGPAPKHAVKEGDIHLPFDTGFVFAEVNADKIYYYQKPHGEFVIGKIDNFTVGRSISCKAVGSNNREDLTYTYKYADASHTERIIQTKIQKQRRRNRTIPNTPVVIEISPPKCGTFKNDCTIDFRMHNRSKNAQHIKFRVVAHVISYRGRIISNIVNQTYETNLDSGSEKSFQEVIRAEYFRKLIWNDMSSVKVEVNGLTNTHDFVHAETIFAIEYPKINIVSENNNMSIGQKYRLNISIENPLDRSLTNTKLYISGDVVINGKLKINIGTLESRNNYEGFFEIFSSIPGVFNIYASLESNELSGFDTNVTVKFNYN